MGRIGCARDERLGLQGFAPVTEQSRAQGLAAYPVTLSPQLDLQAARAVAAIVGVKNRHHFRFPSRRWLPHWPHRLLQTPGVVAAGDDPDHLAELLNWIVSTLLINKWQHAHEAGGMGEDGDVFFKMSSSCANRLFAALARTSAASAGSAGKGGWASFCQA